MEVPAKQISILAGASGAGKTTLVLQALKGGFPLTLPSPVAYVVADRTKDEVLKRSQDLGLKGVEIYGIVDDPSVPLDLVNHPGELLKLVVGKFKNPFKLLVLDPVALFIEGNGIDYKLVAKSLIRLNRYAIEHEVTIFACHHTVKQRTDFAFVRAQDRISGSAAYQGFSGTQMVLIEGREKGVDFDTFIMIPHMGPPEQYRLSRKEDGYFVVQDSSERFGEILKFHFSTSPFTFTKLQNVMAASGFSEGVTFSNLKEMLAEGSVKLMGRDVYRLTAPS